ncbi:uncharacterized protein F4812DRAFT_467823 [Daldinia caldariorum]|uniref:uncharacterized protein n=1 Tax=Daldinia caldariorum TaxID=326644 RepID=UPI002007E831|nr:uncharacterized protein F4812DRAFT_467823 [Daldinia caldariorum]KAI1471936.1 hypothetical protein F4812DRAFT_467823 [Daldinia caldariorum]
MELKHRWEHLDSLTLGNTTCERHDLMSIAQEAQEHPQRVMPPRHEAEEYVMAGASLKDPGDDGPRQCLYLRRAVRQGGRLTAPGILGSFATDNWSCPVYNPAYIVMRSQRT